MEGYRPEFGIREEEFRECRVVLSELPRVKVGGLHLLLELRELQLDYVGFDPGPLRDVQNSRMGSRVLYEGGLMEGVDLAVESSFVLLDDAVDCRLHLAPSHFSVYSLHARRSRGFPGLLKHGALRLASHSQWLGDRPFRKGFRDT